MKVGSLFSGYGGLDMAVGGDLAWYSEIEPAACKVMEAHHPGVPNLGDITKVDWAEVEPVDVITGGYPCQPFSNAGKRKGKDDERHLWPHVRDALSAIRPRRAVLENVRGHLTLGFDVVLSDLADLGWSARWGVVRAADAGAPHNRARLFIVASNPDSLAGSQGGPRSRRSTALAQPRTQQRVERSSGSDVADAQGEGLQGREPATEDHETGLARGRATAEGDRAAADRPRTERRAAQSDDLQARGTTELRERAGAAANPSVVGCGTQWPEPTGQQREVEPDGDGSARWGNYAPAIDRWQHVIGRPAPSPTIQRSGRDRLNPVFVEWMMGLPEGWVTGHGLSASQELKMLGNGVVPQQAALALRLLGAA